MPTKQTPILNHWLTIGSIAFGVSFGCALPFTQNLAQSALIGLATMPGVAATLLVRSRQRQQQVHRQLERGKVRLHQLQQQGKILNEQLQMRGKDCQATEIRVAQLHSLAASLTDRTHRDRLAIEQLDRQLATLTLDCEEKQAFAMKLDRKIQDKQARSLEVTTNFNSLKLELSQLQAEQFQVQGSRDRAKIVLRDTQVEIDRCSVIKRELERQIRELQHQQQTAAGSLGESIDRQQLLRNELDVQLDLALQDKQVQLDRIASEILSKNHELELCNRELETAQLELHNSLTIETELALQKQAQLAELESEIIDRNNTIELSNRELKRANLELSSRQAELDNLALKIHVKLQAIDEIDLEKDLRTFEPKPPIVSRSIELHAAGEWYDKFSDNPHLSVLQHIEKHGTITEAEASSKLGNARSVRQFANKLAEYTQYLPFSIRVESSPKGNRYLKEDRN